MNYLLAKTLHEAVELQKATGYAFLAGGTDVYPALEHGWRPAGLLDISRVPELGGGIREEDGWWILPALTTWTDLTRAQLPPLFDGVRQAAVEVGGRQIQNQATIAGNICNASPAADGITALMALDASVVVSGSSGMREVLLSDFVLGNRKTQRTADELVVQIKVKAATGRHASVFSKHGSRKYLVISLVMTGAFIEVDSGDRIAGCGISVGACAARSLKLTTAESRLRGMTFAAASDFSLNAEDLAMLSPIDDVRASAAYRLRTAKYLVERDVHSLVEKLKHG